MEEWFEEPPSCISLGNEGRMAIGCVDGSVQMVSYNMEEMQVRSFVHTWTRCIVEGHKNKPNAICLLQPTARKHQQFASGDEEGEIHTWDFRAQNPKICTWKEQDSDVNALAIDGRHNLISASSDGTIAAYEVRKCKLRMKSEMMHSELLSLCVTDNLQTHLRYVYAGGRDGYLEVFVHGDYGNILERIDSGFDMVILSFHTISPDGLIFVSLAGFANTIKIWPLQELLKDIPVLRSVDVKKKRTIVKEGFFDDLVRKKKKRIADIHEEGDEDEDSNSDRESSDEEEESLDRDFYYFLMNRYYITVNIICLICRFSIIVDSMLIVSQLKLKENLFKIDVTEMRHTHLVPKNSIKNVLKMNSKEKDALLKVVRKIRNIYGQDNKDEGELLDSDDEINDEDEYMKKVLQSTIDDYTLEESEIDRRLMCLGVGSDVEQLMLKLTDEEKTAYAQLAEQIHLDETGLEDSCFRMNFCFYMLRYVSNVRLIVRKCATQAEVINAQLQKQVLLIGGSRFSVFGRPFLDKNSVCVEATVVEKTTKSPELHYVHRNHQHIKSVNWISCETTVLRINDISAKATLMEHAS
uniref:WD_REPEATS_REGION domain-containing protein n=1 Tax=Heterorhabditis bacteriophora TaxID=37862 RepID=A0A1I7X4D6_HETBA